MKPARDFFTTRYVQAREEFLAAAEAAGLVQHAHRHPMLGVDGETLAMDLALAGAADAQALLIVSSGCHGVEGFCGSAVQRAVLAEPRLLDEAAAAGVALLFVHGLNPYGFSWWRRTTHENVDLNRNFVDFHQPLPANPEYDELAHLIVPPSWPPSATVREALARYVAVHGLQALQAVVSRGQYRHPEGLFYGGQDPTWSQQILRHVLQEHGQRCRRLGWIDIHTGLGPNGHGELIFAGRDDAAATARARAWWGPEVTSIYDGTSSSSRVGGMCCLAVAQECPQAEHTGIALEFGTVPIETLLDALRADQWLENHPETDAPTRHRIKQALLEAFYTDTDEWKARIVEQGLAVTRRAVQGLAAH